MGSVANQKESLEENRQEAVKARDEAERLFREMADALFVCEKKVTGAYIPVRHKNTNHDKISEDGRRFLAHVQIGCSQEWNRSRGPYYSIRGTVKGAGQVVRIMRGRSRPFNVQKIADDLLQAVIRIWAQRGLT